VIRKDAFILFLLWMCFVLKILFKIHNFCLGLFIAAEAGHTEAVWMMMGSRDSTELDFERIYIPFYPLFGD
jgi:hypothetical protein